MGTRGAYGFFINGDTKVSYNHYDSYPSGLGEHVVGFLRSTKVDDALRECVKNLRGVQEDDTPTASDIKMCRSLKLDDPSVGDSTKGGPSWYQLLRKTQGKLDRMLKAGVYIDSKSFLANSLFCEWAYILNMDSNMLEVYKGFQEEAHTKGRYADWPGRKSADKYFPVALVKEIPFNDLPAVGKLEDRVSESDVEALARTGGRL